jgi:fructose-1,6-bisphosphatase II / sedoheptulose-1,7-bisphosphatase
VDFAVDPCEGTNLCANSQRGSMAVLAASDRCGLFNAPDFYMKKLAAPPAAKGKVDIRKSATENIAILSECLGMPADELVIVVMDRARHKDLIKEIRATGARVQPISDGDVQAAIACGFAGTGTHCLMGIGAAPEGVISAAALRALGAHFQGQLVYDPAVAQTSEWEGLTKEGNLARLAEMGISDPDKVYEAEELASGENVMFAGSGITDGLLFDGVKFEKDCTRTSSLVISTLDNTARFTTTVHIKDGAQSIALR